MVKHEWSLANLRSKAEFYCATAEHCSYEVRLKLQQWSATDEQIEHIVAHLQKERFVDEQRYCNAFVHDKLLYQGWGRMKMRAQLQAKHLPTAAIEQALNEIDRDTYMSVLTRVLATKKRSIKSADPQAREKLIRFAMQRGFTNDEINGII
ncbi:MAG: RecX family transcriptional regulator [Bacteroidales bacterium]|nr:RecX family transcriptional regulator [Bacteroidales bacterium]